MRNVLFISFLYTIFFSCFFIIPSEQNIDTTTKLNKAISHYIGKEYIPLTNDFIMGVAGGTGDVLLGGQLLLHMKLCAQQNRSFSFNPRIWTKGIFVNMISMAPITAVQILVNGILNRIVTTHSTSQLAINAFTAGAASALVSGPSEYCIIQQGIHKLSFLKTVKLIRSDYGLHTLLRGLTPTVLREGGFAAGFLFLPHYLKDHINRITKTDSVASSVLSPVLSGIFVATVTHPFDTIKTIMQSDPQKRNSLTMLTTVAHLRENGGLKNLYRGFGWRASSICTGIVTIHATNTHLRSLIT